MNDSLTKFTIFKAYTTFGLVLLIIGILFDFLFVQWRASDIFKTDPIPYLNSFGRLLLGITKFYMIIFGLLSIIFAFLTINLPVSIKLDWTIFGLLVGGSILIILTGIWYANTGPSFRWEPKCYVLTVGLLAIVFGMGLEIYKILGAKYFS